MAILEGSLPVHRVARAIEDAMRHAAPGVSPDVYRDAARRALQAMREPSVAMDDAAFALEVEFRSTMGTVTRGYCHDVVFVWQAMIDAALAEAQNA